MRMREGFCWLSMLFLPRLHAQDAAFRDDFERTLKSGWQWIDPKGDSVISLDARHGFLRIEVGGYHDLWEGSGDYHAPRLMRAVEGDFTVTTKIAGPGRWCGGILVWKDYRNFVRLDRGTHFRNEVMLSGTNNGPVHHAAADYIEGDPLWLRLERRGAMFTAVYSRDGKQWHPLQRLYAGTKVQPPEGEDGYSRLSEQDLAFEEGQSRLEMAAKGALQVGLFAICPQPDDGGPKRTVTDFDFFEVK